MRHTELDFKAYWLLVGCCLFWGSQQILIKLTVPEIAPLFQAFLRFGVATLLLMLWCKWRKIPLWEKDQSLKSGLLVGSLFASEFALFYVGIQFTEASRLTLFLHTSPFWVALLLPLKVPAERLNTWQWAGLILAFLGVVMAFSTRLGGQNLHPLGWLGDALALLAGLAWGLTTVFIRGSKLTQVSPEKLLLYQISVSALILPMLSLAFQEKWHFQWSNFAWLSMAIQTVVGAFGTYLAWMWLLNRYPATRISTFAFLTPVFAMLLGVWWLGEPMSFALFSALVLVAVGIVLVNRKAS